MKHVCIALHGFLGKPTDWGLFAKSRDHFFPLDYLKIKGLGPELDFCSWALRFNEYVLSAFPNCKRDLYGYSLGGRLALHACRQHTDIWNEIFLFSTHPGLQDDQQKEIRLQADEEWAQKFLNADWNELMSEWNRQAVFLDDPVDIKRVEFDYNRSQLVQILRAWSLGRQQDFRSWLLETDMKITWHAGEKDEKFCQILNQLVLGKNQKKVYVKNRGHRLL